MKNRIKKGLAHLKPEARKLTFLLLLLTAQGKNLVSQQTYDNFEGNSLATYFISKQSQLDTAAANPAPDSVNGSGKCAKYMRSHIRYDNIKMLFRENLDFVESYTNYEDNAPKIRMKVYTTAPVGSIVSLQLGKAGNSYPKDINSLFEARTTVSGKWEILEFKFAAIPKGSETPADKVNQINLLFNPNTNATYTWYFDELEGPEKNNPLKEKKWWKLKS